MSINVKRTQANQPPLPPKNSQTAIQPLNIEYFFLKAGKKQAVTNDPRRGNY